MGKEEFSSFVHFVRKIEIRKEEDLFKMYQILRNQK